MDTEKIDKDFLVLRCTRLEERIAELEKDNTKLGMKSIVLDLAKGHLTQCEAALVERDKRIAELEENLSECLQMLDNFHKNIGSLGAKNLADRIRNQAKSIKGETQ